MFERFTDEARQVVVLAQDEARALGHTWIGTEHILLGLLREEEGIASQVLESLGVELEQARADVARRVDSGKTGDSTVMGQMIPFTPRAKKVLELSLREALALGHNEIDTEHILLGLARENEGVASRILDELGADAQTIRRETLIRRPEASRRRRRRREMRWGPPTPARWEYHVEQPGQLSAEWLNALGANGWELVTATPDAAGVTFVFKRLVRLPGRQKPPPEPEPEAA